MPKLTSKRMDPLLCRRPKNVSFSDQVLVNYIVDNVGDDPEWFTQCTNFQSMKLCEIHGLTESFTLGRESWGKLNQYHHDNAKAKEVLEWSKDLRPKITQLILVDLDCKVRYRLPQKDCGENRVNSVCVCKTKTMQFLSAQEICENAKNEKLKIKRREQLLKKVKNSKKK